MSEEVLRFTRGAIAMTSSELELAKPWRSMQGPEDGVTPGFFEKLQTETWLEETLRRENIRIIRSHKIIARIFGPWGDVSTQ